MMRNSLILIFLTFLLACDEEPSDISIEPGYDFFPVKMGQYRTYWVEEVNFGAFGGDTSRYFLSEVISDSLISGDGTVKYLVERSKSTDSITWKLDSIWTVHRFKDIMIVTENNVPYAKMAFPVIAGNRWDGNAFNAQPEKMYYYQAISQLTHLESTGASDFVQVIIEDIEENLVNQDERSETYAKGIGLVEKDYVTLQFCSANCGELGEIQSGRILKQNLVGYGPN
ncbi:hypothetical protein [Marinoscillum sp.]|uniref:hypothetical protein n=1 Tax=Marinoscillum sp. TaxID=2024838 RepID=UPI003BABF304